MFDRYPLRALKELIDCFRTTCESGLLKAVYGSREEKNIYMGEIMNMCMQVRIRSTLFFSAVSDNLAFYRYPGL